MCDNLVESMLMGTTGTNASAHAKELLLQQSEQEFNNGNILYCIFYQVRALLQEHEVRYYQIMAEETLVEKTPACKMPLVEKWLQQSNAYEKNNIKSNPLMQHVLKTLQNSQAMLAKTNISAQQNCNFLQNIVDPLEGIKKIEQVCQQMPKEWTIIQLCKGSRSETTYSIFPQIHQRDAAIYLTILRHVRSSEYPAPIGLRFCGPEQFELFTKFGSIASKFKNSINVDPKDWTSKEAKKIYWEMLSEINQFIACAVADLKNFFYPWNFLFTGRPLATTSASSTSSPKSKYYEKYAFKCVDDFCDKYHWEANERVLLSLAALHITSLSELEMHAICNILTSSEREQASALKLLLSLQNPTEQQPSHSSKNNSNSTKSFVSKHYPCILIVDECLDQFFWEEMNVEQEFCRVNSLQCLWRLFNLYKKRIKCGYLNVSITDGGCLVNPDCNLPKTEMRMRSFLEYWIPHWRMQFSEKPTQDQLFNDLFKRPCYIYAGHGSSLQYINGKHISRQQMNAVVFLFGCDSSRMHSNGLYSELVGSHLFYHAAMCPTLVGTLIAGLDANMDDVATDILSRWIAPKSKNVLPWDEIELHSWIKEGVIKPDCNQGEPRTIAKTSNYHIGSLCAILARVHQRDFDSKLYNTAPYVCRGLPAWNVDVQALPL